MGSILFFVLALAAPAQALTVDIEQPVGGIVSSPTVELLATVSDPAAQTAVVVMNGASYHVPIEQGRIHQTLVVVPGNNRVGVVVEHAGVTARSSRTFRYEGEPMELVVLLTWPSRGEIVDLWVREPGGETCKWDHRQTHSGGHLLDFSADAIGFGSQAYILPSVRAGRFRVKVHYWGAYADDDNRSIWSYDELIERLDQAEQGRRRGEIDRARAALDAWSRPAAPQTPVRAEVILFPGSRFERRWRFDVTVHRTGQLSTVGEIEIDEALVRRVREEVR